MLRWWLHIWSTLLLAGQARLGLYIALKLHFMKHKDFTQQSCSARDKEDLSSSHVNVCTGCPKNSFLVEIKRRNEGNLYTIGADGEGFTLWSKNSYPPPACRCQCHHPLRCEIILKGHCHPFWFLSGTPCSRTHFDANKLLARALCLFHF